MAYDKKRDDGWFSWALIIFCFVTGTLAPLGLLLLLMKVFGKDNKPKRTAFPPQGRPIEVRASGMGSAPPGETNAAQSGKARNPSQPSRTRQAVQKSMKSPVPKKANALLLKIGGAILLFGGAITTGMALDDVLWFLTDGDVMTNISWWLPELLQALAILSGGGVLLGAGISMDRGLKRYAKYLSVMGDRDAMPVDELARTLGYSVRRVEKDLQKMIDRGYFGGKAYLNVEYGHLFRSDEAAERFRRHLAAETQQTPKEVEEGYSGILRKIRRTNDAIADPVLSAKIDRLEEIAGRIFKAVEEDPQKRGKIDTFLNYYLPTTQKLLDSYAEFEAAGVEGENLRQAKQRIETTMDSIVKGFEHQLDELYKTDVLDVDSDIRVMETMLRWDTASTEKDFGLSKPEGGEQ